MRDENKAARQRQIEQAAFEILQEKGYGGTSMLTVARKAQASNETLYNWYGDKVGLFRAIISSNAEEAKKHLENSFSQQKPSLDVLREFGPLLLDLLMSDRAIALNRAAAADQSGELGKALAKAGRGAIVPLLDRLFKKGGERGELKFDQPQEAVEFYLNVLIGELQISRIIGRAKKPSHQVIIFRADRALSLLQQVYGTD